MQRLYAKSIRLWVLSPGRFRGAGCYAESSFRAGGIAVAKYLIQASYTAEGARGLVRGGGSARRKAIDDIAAAVGGKIEAFYFAFGEYDAVIVAEFPSHSAASAVALAVGASGAVRTTTTVLMSPEEVDEAAKLQVSYRAPGQ